MPGLVSRSRTPPDVKWLLNERAALLGKVAKAEGTLLALRQKQAHLERRLANVLRSMKRAQTVQSRAQATIDAIDTTLGLAHSRVEPTAAGVVSAWAGRYGKRGGLGEFVARSLELSAPTPMTTAQLLNLAAKEFGVVFVVPADRRSFRKSVSSALTSLFKQDLVERLPAPSETSHGSWRWKSPVPSLSSLRQKTSKADA